MMHDILNACIYLHTELATLQSAFVFFGTAESRIVGQQRYEDSRPMAMCEIWALLAKAGEFTGCMERVKSAFLEARSRIRCIGGYTTRLRLVRVSMWRTVSRLLARKYSAAYLQPTR